MGVGKRHGHICVYALARAHTHTTHAVQHRGRRTHAVAFPHVWAGKHAPKTSPWQSTGDEAAMLTATTPGQFARLQPLDSQAVACHDRLTAPACVHARAHHIHCTLVSVVTGFPRPGDFAPRALAFVAKSRCFAAIARRCWRETLCLAHMRGLEAVHVATSARADGRQQCAPARR